MYIIKSEKARELIKNDSLSIKKYFDVPIEDEKLMFELILINPFAISFTSIKILKKFKYLSYVALSLNPFTFEFLPNELKKNKLFIIDMLNSYLGPNALTPKFLDYVDPKIKDDADFMKYVIDDYFDDSSLTKYLSKRLQADKKLILSLKRYNLSDLSKKLRNDKDIIEHLLYADKEYYRWFKGAGNKIKKNKEFILKCYANSLDTRMLKDIDKNLFSNKEFIISLMKINGLVRMEEVNKKLLNNKNFVKKLIPIDVEIIEYVSQKLKKDRELILFCINQMKDQKDINCTFRPFESFKYFFSDKDILNSLIKKGMTIEDMGEYFDYGRDTVIAFISHNGANLQFAGEEQQKDIYLQKIAKNSRLSNL